MTYSIYDLSIRAYGDVTKCYIEAITYIVRESLTYVERIF